MDLTKAICVYLYEKDQPPGQRNERLYQAAWRVIETIGQEARSYEDSNYNRFTIIRGMGP